MVTGVLVVGAGVLVVGVGVLVVGVCVVGLGVLVVGAGVVVGDGVVATVVSSPPSTVFTSEPISPCSFRDCCS